MNLHLIIERPHQVSTGPIKVQVSRPLTTDIGEESAPNIAIPGRVGLELFHDLVPEVMRKAIQEILGKVAHAELPDIALHVHYRVSTTVETAPASATVLSISGRDMPWSKAATAA
jgi:hypothetical protein